MSGEDKAGQLSPSPARSWHLSRAPLSLSLLNISRQSLNTILLTSPPPPCPCPAPVSLNTCQFCQPHFLPASHSSFGSFSSEIVFLRNSLLWKRQHVEREEAKREHKYLLVYSCFLNKVCGGWWSVMNERNKTGWTTLLINWFYLLILKSKL